MNVSGKCTACRVTWQCMELSVTAAHCQLLVPEHQLKQPAGPSFSSTHNAQPTCIKPGSMLCRHWRLCWCGCLDGASLHPQPGERGTRHKGAACVQEACLCATQQEGGECERGEGDNSMHAWDEGVVCACKTHSACMRTGCRAQHSSPAPTACVLAELLCCFDQGLEVGC